MFSTDVFGPEFTGLCQFQDLPLFLFKKVPTAPYFLSPLQELFPGDSFFVSLQEEVPGFFGQPDKVSVLPAIRVTMPTPARTFFSRSKSTGHLSLSKGC